MTTKFSDILPSTSPDSLFFSFSAAKLSLPDLRDIPSTNRTHTTTRSSPHLVSSVVVVSMNEKLEESVHHILCGAFCHSLIEEVLTRSSSSLGPSSKLLLKQLWLEKLHFNIHSQPIITLKKRKHWRLREECESYPHPCSSLGKPEIFMEKPIIDFHRGVAAQLEYISCQV